MGTYVTGTGWVTPSSTVKKPPPAYGAIGGGATPTPAAAARPGFAAPMTRPAAQSQPSLASMAAQPQGPTFSRHAGGIGDPTAGTGVAGGRGGAGYGGGGFNTAQAQGGYGGANTAQAQGDSWKPQYSSDWMKQILAMQNGQPPSGTGGGASVAGGIGAPITGGYNAQSQTLGASAAGGNPSNNPQANYGLGYDTTQSRSMGAGGAYGQGVTGNDRANLDWNRIYSTPNNPYGNVNPYTTGGSSYTQDAINNFRNLPSQIGQAQNAPNPSDWYPRDQANGYLQNLFGQGTSQAGPQNNPFLQYGQGMLNNANLDAPNMPNAPSLHSANTNYQAPQGAQQRYSQVQGAPSSYTTPNAPQIQQAQIQGAPTSYNAPSLSTNFDQIGQNQFNPNSVQGPNVTQRGVSYDSANAGVPDFNTLYGLGMQANNYQGAKAEPTIGRDQMQGSNWNNNQTFGNPNAVSTQGYQSALGASQALANTDLSANTKAMTDASTASQNDIFKRAAESGLNASGARGFGDPQGTISGMEMGTRLGEAARAASADQQQALLNASLQTQGQQLGARQAGAEQLGSLGSSAANAAQGYGSLFQNEANNMNQGNLQQRGQDVTQRGQNTDLSQFNANLGLQARGQGMQGVADLARVTGDIANTGFQNATQRGLGQQGLEQSGQLGGYNAATGRMETQGNLANQYNQNQTANYQAATQRGLGVGGLQNDNNQLGFQYAGLGAQNQNQYNTTASNNQNTYNQQFSDNANANNQLGFQYANLGANNQNTANRQNFDYSQLGSNNTLANNQNQLNWAQLNSGNQNQFNQAQTDLYGQQANAANNAYNNQTGRWGQVAGAAQGFGNTYQQGQQNQMQNRVQMGQLAGDLLNGSAQAQQAYSQMQQAAASGDQGALQRLLEFEGNLDFQRYQLRKNGQSQIGGSLINMYGNMVGSAAQAAAGGGG